MPGQSRLQLCKDPVLAASLFLSAHVPLADDLLARTVELQQQEIVVITCFRS